MATEVCCPYCSKSLELEEEDLAKALKAKKKGKTGHVVRGKAKAALSDPGSDGSNAGKIDGPVGSSRPGQGAPEKSPGYAAAHGNPIKKAEGVAETKPDAAGATIAKAGGLDTDTSPKSLQGELRSSTRGTPNVIIVPSTVDADVVKRAADRKANNDISWLDQ